MFVLDQLRCARRCRQQQPLKLVASLDIGELGDVAIDEIVGVGLEEPRATTLVAANCFRKATPADSLDVALSGLVAPGRQSKLVREERVDDST